MSLKSSLKADIAHLNTSVQGKPKPAFVLFFIKKHYRIVILFRILNHFYVTRNKPALLLLAPLQLYYRLMTNRYCIDLSPKTRIAPGFKLNHSYGIVINTQTTIGENAYIGHNVTIGSNGPENFPTIGKNVTIFTGSIIIGKINIGDNAVIGAGSLVVKDVPANTVVVGNACRVLKQAEEGAALI